MPLSHLVLLAVMMQAQSAESPAARDARMAWWRDARFGMFIHWGAYAVAAGTYKGERIPGIGEWIMSRAHVPIPDYEEFVHRFNPVRFDPDAWVRIAKDAGMKYIVITSKHHDGFAIFDSKISRYDIVDATPYKRDALKALAQAAHRAGMRFGVYYSIMDWHHPDAQGPNAPGLERPEPGGPDRPGRFRDPLAAGAPRGASGRRLGNVHDDERHLGLQIVRRRLEGHAHTPADADRRGLEGRQLSPQRWPDGGRCDPHADRVAAARDGRLDEGQR